MSAVKTSSRNHERAGWAETGLRAFCSDTRQTIENDGNEEVISDFLCDLQHYCDINDLDFDALLDRGSNHHTEETDTVCTKCGAKFCGFDEGMDSVCNDCCKED